MVCANETQTRLAEEQNTLKWKKYAIKKNHSNILKCIQIAVSLSVVDKHKHG